MSYEGDSDDSEYLSGDEPEDTVKVCTMLLTGVARIIIMYDQFCIRVQDWINIQSILKYITNMRITV